MALLPLFLNASLFMFCYQMLDLDPSLFSKPADISEYFEHMHVYESWEKINSKKVEL
jgi:hypothetical protein